MYFNPEECGARIKKLRKSRGLTQEQLGGQLHISRNHMASIESGRRSASIDLIVEIALYFHTTTDYLLLGANPAIPGIGQKASKAAAAVAELEAAIHSVY